MKQRTIACSAILGALVVVLSGCSRFSSANRHLRRGDKYFAEGSYLDAEIEYRNVIQSDRLNAKAISRLGIIYYDEGNPRKALPFLVKANDLKVDDQEFRQRFAAVSLDRGDLAGAREQARLMLQQNPANQQAPSILARASRSASDIAAARSLFDKLQLNPDAHAGVLIGDGYLSQIEGKLGEAEQFFRKAVAADPKSCDAELDLGSLYLRERNLTQAEQSFEAALKVAPPRSQAGLKYAEIKILKRDFDSARKALEGMVHDTPDYVPSILLLAELDSAQKRYAEGKTLVDRVLQRDPENLEALILEVRIRLATGETAKATDDLVHLTQIYTKYAPAYSLLGQAYLAQGDAARAVTSLSQAVALDPTLTEAVILLARANIMNGNFKAASSSLATVLQQHPDLEQALLLQAQALRGQGDFEGALDVYHQLETSRPKDPQMPLFTGLLLLQQNRRREARDSFNRALEISPTYLAATEQLINLELIEKNYPEALRLAKATTEKNPALDLPWLLVAKVYLAQNDTGNTEAALAKAIELKPDGPTAYFLMAELYKATNRNEKALADLKQVLEKNPKDLRALMLEGVILDGQKNYTAAAEAYEKILSNNPKISPALNNLAYLYSEKLDQLDKGFEMAQRARALEPQEPHVADTLGWILYKKHQFTWALSLLQESADNSPGDAEVQYHLGMVHYMMGEEDLARASLQKALELKADFSGSDEAKARLSTLAMKSKTGGGADTAQAEQALITASGDPVAQARLADLYERDGKVDKAITVLEASLTINPANVKTMLNLVRLYNAKGDPEKAMELAKSAHNLAPNDLEVSRTLSRLAYETRDYQWSYSLQETARAKADDPEAQFDLAEAAFSVGKVTESEEAMRDALASGLKGKHLDEARRFTEVIKSADSQDKAHQDTSGIDRILVSDPGYGPALYALGVIDEAKGDGPSAVQNYEKLLAEYPDFLPAKRGLTVLYSVDPTKDDRTSGLGKSAIEAYPEDPGVTKALGMVAYRKENYAVSADMLSASAKTRADDADLMFYLGMSQLQLKDKTGARKALSKAVELGLNPELTAEAHKALDSIK